MDLRHKVVQMGQLFLELALLLLIFRLALVECHWQHPVFKPCQKCLLITQKKQRR
jgi:hypothetical protein